MTLLLFRVGALYFRKITVSVIRGDSVKNKGNVFFKELLLALESARTRLAVAVAAETKSTPPQRWQYYLETADQMCRCLRKLRKPDGDNPAECQDWRQALETLRQLPLHGEALTLCQILRKVVSEIDTPDSIQNKNATDFTNLK